MWTQPERLAQQMERFHSPVYIVSHTVYVIRLSKYFFFTGNQMKLKKVRMKDVKKVF
jgi:hypothetical protein